MKQGKRESGLRRHWRLARGVAFLNHGSFGACPAAILEHQTELRAMMEAEPVQFLWRRYEERLESARRALARFVGARPANLVFVTNATNAINAVMRSIKWKRGDAVLTTNLDYNACRNVLVHVPGGAGATVQVAQVPFPLKHPDEIVEAIFAAVTRRTRLAMVDHVTSNTALILPIERIVRELEARGVETLVDGAHAPGMVPLALERLAAAYYTGNLHKWVCAPKGAAFLWTREDKQAGLHPAVISHGHNTPREGYSSYQDRFDWGGTLDPTAWFCVPAAIEWMGRLFAGGWPELRRRNHRLVIEARRMLCERLALSPPCPESLLGSMATLPLPERFQRIPRSGKIDSEQRRLYDAFGIEVPFMRFGRTERRWFRISAQAYNTIEDYERLAEGILML